MVDVFGVLGATDRANPALVCNECIELRDADSVPTLEVVVPRAAI
jgi:hypothetical protein